jgi:hypothetical protein
MSSFFHGHILSQSSNQMKGNNEQKWFEILYLSTIDDRFNFLFLLLRPVIHINFSTVDQP